jgi:hypothetical protein
MGAVTEVARDAHSSASVRADEVDLSFLPKNLIGQCRSLIESYHEVHGFACLPDILWKSRLGPFIEKQPELRQFLRKASTTRSAKKANEGFVQIATVILSLEILASSFAGWSAIYPVPGEKARAILKRNARTPQMPLMEFYLYPPKYISTAAIATLAPPATSQAGEAQLYYSSKPELSGEKLALSHVNSLREALDAKLSRAAEATTN